ncbi:hypothetical protein D9758_007659 [Tetrapyrgos nigripes]|uniref:Uncharacterized protein n=1 Tax=Tetrapyrgos nigripes TaxID=182062 RepID=A0A8H5G5G7_9AGAR|nr:hypothetical protein D9758_007659 [Tetrapyrgos nigripes]
MAVQQITLAQAELIGLIVHTCLFGIYIVLFVRTLPFDLGDRSSLRFRDTNKVLFTANCLLFALIFAHWVVQIHRSQKAFIKTAGEPLIEGTIDPATAFYAFPADPLNLLKEALYLTQTFVGDCTMIYRLWVVYNKNFYITILPIMIMIVYLVSAIAVDIALGLTKPGEDIFISTAGRWAIMVFCTTVATNILTTSLIIYRVYTIQKRVHGGRGGNVLSVLHIMIESAFLYTSVSVYLKTRSLVKTPRPRNSPNFYVPSSFHRITAILTLIGYSSKMTWQFITIDMISPIIGISFTLIAVRVNRHNSISDSTAQHSSNVVRITGRGPENRREEIGLGSLGGGGLSVSVSQQITKHSDVSRESIDLDKDVEEQGKTRAF